MPTCCAELSHKVYGCNTLARKCRHKTLTMCSLPPAALYPIDTIKTRMQMARTGGGVRALFKSGQGGKLYAGEWLFRSRCLGCRTACWRAC